MNRSLAAAGWLLFASVLFTADAIAADVRSESAAFVQAHCVDCHSGEFAEAGLDFDQLSADLADPATFAHWERVFDRVNDGEMPPADAPRPASREVETLLDSLSRRLVAAHSTVRETALRRLNRREYQNTLNDTFGTNLDFTGLLPEDGRSHEFDTVGDALSVSATHLVRYIEAAGLVWDAAVVDSIAPPRPEAVVASYATSREGDQFIGKVWRKLSDGAVVRFGAGGYPSGMLRGTDPKIPGRHRITVRGYAFQTDGEPLTFSVNGTSFARGSGKPVYGYFEMPPGQPGDMHEVTFEADVAERYMVQIEPYGLRLPNERDRPAIDDYAGPGLAILDVTLERLPEPWPSRGHELIFAGIDRQEVMPSNPSQRQKTWYRPSFRCSFPNERAASDAAAASLVQIASAVFRRPVEREEISSFLALYEAERDAGTDFESALKVAFSALLCSPRFLFLDEPVDDAGRLDQHALAARLAYFLTRTAPDEDLRRAARAGQLSNPTTLRAHTERLLRQPDRARFLQDFADAWLDLREIDFTAPDGALFPEFDDYLRWSMPRESLAFLEKLLVEDRPVRDLIEPEYALLNARLAELYAIPGVEGPEIRSVALPTRGAGSLRGGLLGQAAVLKVTANGTNTSPVVRGVWVLERLLGTPPSPPPPGTPGVEPDTRGTSTLRELLAAHRSTGDCQSCHDKIDPPGFAMEQFDPIGGLRDRYRTLGEGERVDVTINDRRVRYRLGPPVDASGELPDGRSFTGFAEFRDLLVEDEDRLARTLAEKLLTFGCGRELGFSDREELDRIVAESGRSGHRVRELLHLCVQSEIFRGP
ncbi:DUF1592 domain-containing protein [Alienimonas chondri]|uniref:Cytochrome c domain-containing protein n=1 Tax=Alienimonas chondri TaxID=2681879 RepID=A0ABX1VBY6_9PLAN|nr:DUF1592 domain-containing protein [Alienimonas chondri]NNJ25574.1 hypothetical protein [Alienimonas chondri]